jgi:chromosome segregation ATPase
VKRLSKTAGKTRGAPCNADYVAAQHERLMADYEKLQKEDADLEAQIKTLDSTLDYHTKDNREQRKVLQERRNTVAKQKDALLGAIAQLQQGMRQLYANVENNLALAKHAET